MAPSTLTRPRNDPRLPDEIGQAWPGSTSGTRPGARITGTADPAGAVLGRSWLTNRWLPRAAVTLLALELGVVVGFVASYRPFDLSIYLWGGRAVTHGLRLYLVQAHANWFTYPPFAAALFTPLTGMPGLLARMAWELGSVAALAWACILTAKLAGYQPSRTLIAAMTAAALLLEPVYHTLYLGQVNLFLLALVLADLWRVARGRPAGLGIGVAAAIKLTPGIFIIVLLLTRRTRDAVIAAATFVSCGLLGYLIDPAASRLYWTRLFYDTRRVSAAYISNQSPYAAAVRILGGPAHVGGWYLLVPLILAAVGLTVATILARRGDWLGAAAVAGTTSLLVSPISWTHHWVWILPALVVLLRGGTGSRITAACGYLLFAIAPMWWTPRSGGAAEYGFHGLVTVTANCFLIAGLAFVAWMAIACTRPAQMTPSAASAARCSLVSLSTPA